MTAPAALQRQLADEHTAKQRQYVLSNARARWSVVGIAVALVLNLAGFALLTALRQGGGGWNWTLYLEESLVLVFCCAALVPMLTKIVRRLRATREVLAQIERGDLTVALRDPESDELGYLGVSVNRTTEAIAATVRQVQRQAHDLAAMAQQLAASAH